MKTREKKSKNQLLDIIEMLMVCIDVGHDFVFVESWSRGGSPSRINWKCTRCDYTKDTKATEKQERLLMMHKTLKPEKAK